MPEQYIDFMKRHNGGEGDIGESWFVLFAIDELQEMNDAYGVQDSLPDHIIIAALIKKIMHVL